MKDVSTKYGCDDYMAYGHTVTSATWQEESAKWTITVKNDTKEFTDTCDVLINAGGVLRFVLKIFLLRSLYSNK